MVVNGSLGIRVFFARTPDDLRAIFRLRYKVYCFETNSLRAVDYPTREETDRFDLDALHIIAKNEASETIGTMRLIRNGPRGFLMEECFELPRWIDRARAVEHSREIVRSDYRGRGITNIMETLAFAGQRKHGFSL